MSKAIAVKAVVKSNEVEGQSCASCGRKIAAPWGRLGTKWVCSHTCHELYKYKLQGIDNNVALVHRLTSQGD